MYKTFHIIIISILSTISIISIISILIPVNCVARPQGTGLDPTSGDLRPDYKRTAVSLNYTRVTPIGSFKDGLNASGNGFALKLGYNVSKLPVTFGMEYHFVSYDYQNTDGITFYSGFDMMLISLRLQPAETFFRPYVELVTGVSWYYTSSDPHIISMFKDYQEDVFYSSLNDDLGVNAGFGAGISILNNKGKSSDVLIDVGFRYLFGSRATVIKKGSIDEIYGYIESGKSTTPTNQIHFLLGITIRF